MDETGKSADAMKSSESTLRALLESAAQAILAVNIDGRLVFANDLAHRIFGYSANELIGQPLDILLPKDAQDRHRRHQQGFFSSPKSRPMGIGPDLQGQRKDGSRFPIEVSLNHIETSEGRLGVAFINDITERKREEEALRESELRYRRLFEHMDEGFAYCKMIFENGVGSDFIYLAVNRRFEALTGMKDVVGKRITEIFPGIRERDPGLFEIYAKVAVTGIHEKFEMFVNTMGQWFSVSVYRPEKGFFVAVFTNITELKRTDAALRQSEERFRLAAEGARLGMVDFDAHTRRWIWSDVSKSHFGLPAEAEVDDEIVRKVVHTEDRNRVQEIVEEANRPGGSGEYAVEFRTSGMNDGVERWIFARGKVFFDSAGRAERILGLTQDITERKRMEEALRQREYEIRTLLDATPDAIMRLDRQLRFAYVNAKTASFTGIPAEVFIGRNIGEVGMPQHLIDLAEARARSAVETGKSSAIEFSYPSPGGTTEWEERLIPEFAPDGSVESVLVIARDVTERKRLEKIAEASRDEIRALAANLLTVQEEERRRVARDLHDQICQQLAALAIDLGRLTTDSRVPGELIDRMKTIQVRAVKASEEARHLAHGLHPAVLDDLGLGASLRDLCDEFTERNPDVGLDFMDDALPFAVSREAAACLYRVAQECLHNIAKHAGAKHVSVRLASKQEAVRLTIADDGAGFDQAAVQGRGGLGLIGMKERARLVNGRLAVAAQPGRGTRITVTIPLSNGSSLNGAKGPAQ